MNRNSRKIVLVIIFFAVVAILWMIIDKPLTGEASKSSITVIPASSSKAEFSSLIQPDNFRIRLDNSTQSIPNTPEIYSIFRYSVRVTNPSFKNADGI